MGYWFVNTPGIGSLIVFGVGLSVLVAYIRMLRWIQTAPRDEAAIVEPGSEPPEDRRR
jgi:hypothetical protein